MVDANGGSVVTRRYYALDGLRGLAALLVISFHYFFVQPYVVIGSPLYYVKSPLKLAWSGVDLFFVLSGYLITNILIRSRKSHHYFKIFYIRRACRILPLYILVILSYLLVRPLLPHDNALVVGKVPYWTYLLFIQNVAMSVLKNPGPSWLTMTWSLAVEEQFYLIVPILVLCLRARRAIPVLVGLVLMAPLLRYLFPSEWAFMQTPFRTDSLLVGSLLAYFMLIPTCVTWCHERKALLHSIFFMLLAGVVVMAARRSLFGPFDFTWLSALYAMLILIAVLFPDGRLSRILSHRLLVWFGGVSFALYMFHEAVAGLAHYLISGYDHPSIRGWGDLWVTVLSFFITCGLAYLSGRYFEKPFRDYGHRIS